MNFSTEETHSAGGVVFNQKGEVLVVNQNGNSWSLPKGHIDSGEDALQAAQREIHEESGVSDLKFIEDLGSYSRYKIGLDGKDDPSERKTIQMFLFGSGQEALKPLDPDNPEARWVPKEQVAALLTHPKDQEFFLGIVSKLDPSLL